LLLQRILCIGVSGGTDIPVCAGTDKNVCATPLVLLQRLELGLRLSEPERQRRASLGPSLALRLRQPNNQGLKTH
jgi:hypothetical protein